MRYKAIEHGVGEGIDSWEDYFDVRPDIISNEEEWI